MPRCAVSIASATPNPCAHRCSRKRMVDSQSMTSSPEPPTAAPDRPDRPDRPDPASYAAT